MVALFGCFDEIIVLMTEICGLQLGKPGVLKSKIDNMMEEQAVSRRTVVIAFTESWLGKLVGYEGQPSVYAGLLMSVFQDHHTNSQFSGNEEQEFQPRPNVAWLV